MRRDADPGNSTIDIVFVSRKKKRNGRKRARRLGLFAKQQLASHIARTSRPRFFTYTGEAECCYQPIYQNRSVLPSCPPFFLPSPCQDRSCSPFPFRCFSKRLSLFLLDTLDIPLSSSLTHAALMSLLRLSCARVEPPLIESSGAGDFIFDYGINRSYGLNRS